MIPFASLEMIGRAPANTHTVKRYARDEDTQATRCVCACERLTASYLDWPDEDRAKGQSCDEGNASRYNDHDVMVEPHTGRTAHHSADTHTHTEKSLLSGWVLFKYT